MTILRYALMAVAVACAAFIGRSYGAAAVVLYIVGGFAGTLAYAIRTLAREEKLIAELTFKDSVIRKGRYDRG